MRPDRADWHCANWAAWMRQGSYAHLKVRLMSAEAGRRYGSMDFDDMVATADVVAARATDAAITDLPPLPRFAVNAYYLGHPWVTPMLLSPTVAAALELVAIALERKGFV